MTIFGRTRAIAVVTIVVFAVVVPSTGPAQQPPPKAEITATPSELFTGDLKRLEPHLGLTCGCVKLDYSGPGTRIRLNIEVWKDGKALRQRGGITAPFRGPGEASISKEVLDAKGNAKYQVTIVLSNRSGHASQTIQVDIPELTGEDTGRGPKTLARAVPLSRDRSVTVWGLMAGRGTTTHHSDESIEEMAQRVEWALLFKLSVDPK